MNEKIKMRILHLIDLGARYEDSSELKEIIDQHSNARELYDNLLKSEENLTSFYGSIDDEKTDKRFDQIIEELKIDLKILKETRFHINKKYLQIKITHKLDKMIF